MKLPENCNAAIMDMITSTWKGEISVVGEMKRKLEIIFEIMVEKNIISEYIIMLNDEFNEDGEILISMTYVMYGEDQWFNQTIKVAKGAENAGKTQRDA